MNSEDNPRAENANLNEPDSIGHSQTSTLRKDVERSLRQYFSHLGEDSVTDLYDLVLTEVEVPLLKAVLNHTGSNQSKASIMLGLNRGTLRKKLKQHGML